MSSGLAASTVDSRSHEQDLAGFTEVEHSRQSASLEQSRFAVPAADKPKLSDEESPAVQLHAIGTSIHQEPEPLQPVRDIRQNLLQTGDILWCRMSTTSLPILGMLLLNNTALLSIVGSLTLRHPLSFTSLPCYLSVPSAYGVDPI